MKVNEHADTRAVSTSTENESIEPALVELREMFPGETNLSIKRTGGDGYVAAYGRLEIRKERYSIFRRVFDNIGSGTTLSEAMEQVRQYHASLNSGEMK